MPGLAVPLLPFPTAAEPPRPEDRSTPSPPVPLSPLQSLRAALPAHLRHRLLCARELLRGRAAPAREPLPTGVAALDRLLGGGLPRGRLVELVGSRSAGRFSLVLAALAAATEAGEAAALVDLGDGLDPRAAAAAGVDLPRLLWARPRRLPEALAAAEAMLAGGFPLVVLDLGLPPVPGGSGFRPAPPASDLPEDFPSRDAVPATRGSAAPRGLAPGSFLRGEAAWTRLARAAQSQGSALLVATPYRSTGTSAAAVVACRRGRPAWSGAPAGRVLVGLAGHLALDKDRQRHRTGGEGLALRVASAMEPVRLDLATARAHRTGSPPETRGASPQPALPAARSSRPCG